MAIRITDSEYVLGVLILIFAYVEHILAKLVQQRKATYVWHVL
jgi:hypothetical protein